MQLNENLILATYLAGIYDVNRNEVLAADDVSIIEAWAESVVELGIHAVVFHNSLSKNSIAKYKTNIHFVKVQFNENYNTNIFRYFLYNDFIQENEAYIKNVFITDITDVVVVNNPFVQPLFINNPSNIFCGDEPKLLQNDWMYDHATHLRSKINDYALYEENFKTATLLNCGIVGGSITIMQPFLQKLCLIHKIYNTDNNTAYTGDMGAFNYLARTQYNAQLTHGTPVNTIFKMYETSRTDCWFRHK
jgi:hypothetical protein